MADDPCDFSFSTSPEAYKHLNLLVQNDEAMIFLHVQPEMGLRNDTALKLNSYDLSVDIELADCINRIRFEHPAVRVVTITSAHPQVFCSGANIYMLKKSSHAFKINFCKYTNETRLYLEEASRYSNIKFIAALNGTAAGGGYELALACDAIILIDDKNASVSLPEVPLLGVLPGTGGLTRLVDKRKIRRDLADAFCTMAEGIKGERAIVWGLVDSIYSKSAWDTGLRQKIGELKSFLPKNNCPGIKLTKISCKNSPNSLTYKYVQVELKDRVAHLTLSAPHSLEPTDEMAMQAMGCELWLVRAFRELDDAILRLRFFYRDHGIWLFRCEGDGALVLEAEKTLYQGLDDNSYWFKREILLNIRRVLRRLDTSARSLICIVNEKSAFSGVLAEILLAADRSFALEDREPLHMALSPMNLGLLSTWNNFSRLHVRFMGDEQKLADIRKLANATKITLKEAYNLGLITYLLDPIDFDDELRVFLEERAALSPDALSAMEANLRFAGSETMASKIFGRLSAWQNWVFNRKNATGERGALTSYGEGQKPQFDFERC